MSWRVGEFPSTGQPHEGTQLPPSALAPWLRLNWDLWRHSQDKINKKIPLKSSHWLSTIYIFPMSHHSNGRFLRSSMKALYSMSSSAAYLLLAIKQHPWSLVPPCCLSLTPQWLDKHWCPWWYERNTLRNYCGFPWPCCVLFTGSAWLPSVQIRGYRQAGQGSTGRHCVVDCPNVLRIFTQPMALRGNPSIAQ